MTISTENNNVRWHQRAGIWMGISINPASLTLGTTIAALLPFEATFYVVPLGVFALSALCIAAGVIGRRNRMRFSEWSGKTFGLGIGVLMMNLLMAFGMSGWSGFQLGLGGTGVANMVGLPSAVGVIIFAAFMFAMSVFGVNQWNRLVWVTTLSSLGLVFVALFSAGFGSAENIQTPPLSIGAIIGVIGSIIAYAGLFALRCTDFTDDMYSDRDVIYDGMLFFVCLLISIMVGVQLFRATGISNLAEILAGMPLAILGQLFLAISFISPALSSQHSGALAWSNVLPITYMQGKIGLITAGALLGITRFDLKLLVFLDWVGVILPAALGTMIIVHFIKRDVSQTLALVAWAAGAIVAISVKLNGQTFHILAGALAGLIVILVGVYRPKLHNPA